MRENAVRLKLAGIQEDYAPLNAPGYQLLRGLVPRENRLETPPQRTVKSAATSVFEPALVQSERAAVYVKDGVVYRAHEQPPAVGMVTTALAVKQADDPASDYVWDADAGPWRLTAFHDHWFLCNGVDLLFYTPSGGGVVLGMSGVKFAAKWNDRLVLGGLSGDWFSGSRWGEVFWQWGHAVPEQAQANASLDFGAHWLFVGEPGGGAEDHPFHAQLAAVGAFGNAGYDAVREVALDALDSGRMTLLPLRTRGDGLCAGELAGRFVVYGSSGITAVSEGEGGPTERVITTTDILAVGLGDKEHLALTTIGWLIRLSAEQAVTMKHGAVFGAPWDGVLIYDEPTGDWYITVLVGPINAKTMVGYALTPQGLGGPVPLTTGLARFAKQLYVTGGTMAGHRIQAVTGKFDLASRGWKHATQVDLDMQGVTGATVTVRSKGETA
jgi:hypothetical protein